MNNKPLFPEDTFTEADVVGCLENNGLKYQVKGRYILSQCPTHDDKNPSVQIYKDDWFVNCHAGCGRYHITKAFPELRGGAKVTIKREKTVEHQYKKFDLMEVWKTLPPIPETVTFKGIPQHELHDLGWRLATPGLGMGEGWFIPYFNQDKTKIPFAQVRHLSGERRFTFLKDAQPTVYGGWNVQPNEVVFIVEGASDALVLQHCMIPWVALPSASSGGLLKRMAQYAKTQNVTMVYAGDNDEAGDKLREALDEVAEYRVCQPPRKYKDWGDFFEAEGAEAIYSHCHKALFGHKLDSQFESVVKSVQTPQRLFPDDNV